MPESDGKEMDYCFGIDVGGTSVKMGLFSVEGKLLEKWEIQTHTENEGEKILPDIAASINEKIEEKGLTRFQITGVGIGVPGPVDDQGIIYGAANLGWGCKTLTKELKEMLGGLNVRAGNDANVAALGEMWLGAGLGEKHVLMVTLGTGVGGGVIADGKILTGASGSAGEFGHMCVNPHETEVCNCGLRGCLEQYASATGIKRLEQLRLAENEDESILRLQPYGAKEVFDAVKKGDRVAIEIAEQFGKYLGYAMATVATVVNPSVIIIGGGVSKAGEVILPYIEKPFRERAFSNQKDTKFVLAMLGNDAGICGAARLVLE